MEEEKIHESSTERKEEEQAQKIMKGEEKKNFTLSSQFSSRFSDGNHYFTCGGMSSSNYSRPKHYVLSLGKRFQQSRSLKLTPTLQFSTSISGKVATLKPTLETLQISTLVSGEEVALKPTFSTLQISTSTPGEEMRNLWCQLLARGQSSVSTRKLLANADLLLEILVRLPVKDLVRYQLVSKSWFSRLSRLNPKIGPKLFWTNSNITSDVDEIEDTDRLSEDKCFIRRRISLMLEPEETPLGALRRLKGVDRKSRLTGEKKYIFDKLTEDCTVLFINGDFDIYNSTKEKLELS